MSIIDDFKGINRRIDGAKRKLPDGWALAKGRVLALASDGAVVQVRADLPLPSGYRYCDTQGNIVQTPLGADDFDAEPVEP